MTENENSPENLRKFLESDDPAMIQMGLSMAKGSGVPDEMLGLVAGLYMWHDDKTVRAAAKSTFMKFAPDELKQILKETWEVSYRTAKTSEGLQWKVEMLLNRFKSTPLNTIDVWIPALATVETNTVLGKTPALCSIVYAIGEIGGTQAANLLIKSLRGDSLRNEWTIRESVEGALAQIGEPAVEPLIMVLRDGIGATIDNNRAVRKHVAVALGKIGDKRAVDPLIKALKDEDDSWVSEYQSVALGKIGDKRAVDPLIKALNENKGAEWGLLEIGGDRAIDALVSKYVVAIGAGTLTYKLDRVLSTELLKSILVKRNLPVSGTKKVLVQRLADFKVGTVEGIEVLVDALRQPTELNYDGGWGREAAAKALRAYGSRGLQSFIDAGRGDLLQVSELKTLLKEKKLSTTGTRMDLIQRFEGVTGEISGEKAASTDIRNLMESENPAEVRKGLTLAKDTELLEDLLGLAAGLYMWHDDKNVRTAAKSTFMKFAPDELKEIIKETWKIKYRVLKDAWDLKSVMINIATHLRGTSLDTVDLWIPAFSRTSGDKVSIIYALGKIGDKRAVEPLTRVLKGWRTGVDSYVSSGIWKDKNWPPVIGFHYGALDTFQALRDSFVEIGEAAVDPLIKALNYKNEALVKMVIGALGQIKDKRAVEPIIKKLAGKNENLSYYAAMALGDLGDERSVPFLIVELEKGRNRSKTILAALYKLGDVRGIKGIIRSWKGGDIREDIYIIQKNLFGIEEIINALGKEHMFVDKTNEYHEFHMKRIRSNILKVLTTVILDGATVSFTKKQVGQYWNFLKLEERLWKNQKSIKKALKKLGHEVE